MLTIVLIVQANTMCTYLFIQRFSGELSGHSLESNVTPLDFQAVYTLCSSTGGGSRRVDCSAACLSDVFGGILSRRLRVLIPLQDPSGAAISRSLQPSWSAQIKFLIGSRNVTITHPHLGGTRSRPGATRLLGRCERGERVESTRQRTLLAR